MSTEREERLARENEELRRENENALRAIGAIVHRFGGVVKFGESRLLNDYTLERTANPLDGTITIRAKVQAPNR